MVETHHKLVDTLKRENLETAVLICNIEAFSTAECVFRQLMRGMQVRGGHDQVLATAPTLTTQR